MADDFLLLLSQTHTHTLKHPWREQGGGVCVWAATIKVCLGVGFFLPSSIFWPNFAGQRTDTMTLSSCMLKCLEHHRSIVVLWGAESDVEK